MTANQASKQFVRSSFELPALTTGFTSITLMWAGWFLANLPGLDIPAPATALLMGALLAVGVILSVRCAGPDAGWKLGLAGGVVAGMVNLIALGSLLVDAGTQVPSLDANLAPAIKPAAPIIAGGFLLACAAVGTIAGIFAKKIAKKQPLCAQSWLSRFGWIAAVATLELILVGGLVTSSESGLAVPDWPGTYGANMFLYPIALMSDHRVFLEHSHRLIGSMVGLTTITLALCVIIRDTRSKVRVMAGVLVALVILQGVLGGLRVTEQSAWLGVFHGILAQLFLALLIAQAVWLSPAWIALERSQSKDLRRWRRMATAATHTTILQLALGAMYRHTASSHALMAHLGLSILVVVLAIMAAAAMNLDHPIEALKARTRLLRRALIGVVSLQVVLGVAALFSVMAAKRGNTPTADELAQATNIQEVPIHELLLATAHQANGAVLLALLTVSLVWAKRAYKKNPAETPDSDI